MQTMTAKRMENPAHFLPQTLRAIPHLLGGIEEGGLSTELRELVTLRASQINGCAACVYGHAHALRKLGESRSASILSRSGGIRPTSVKRNGWRWS